jgi:hypothetical protein
MTHQGGGLLERDVGPDVPSGGDVVRQPEWQYPASNQDPDLSGADASPHGQPAPAGGEVQEGRPVARGSTGPRTVPAPLTNN